MSAFAICMLPDILWGEKNTQETIEETIVTYGDEYGFSENVDTMLKLQEDEWQLLTLEEKVEVMQCVAYCEARYLGLWTPITVKVTEIERETTLGRYDDSEYTIYVDKQHMANSLAVEVLETVCHEVYHAYSYRLVEVYNYTDGKMRNLKLFANAAQYKEDFGNYITAEEDLLGYRMQDVEADAFSYGEYAAGEYYKMIADYLEENSQEE